MQRQQWLSLRLSLPVSSLQSPAPSLDLSQRLWPRQSAALLAAPSVARQEEALREVAQAVRRVGAVLLLSSLEHSASRCLRVLQYPRAISILELRKV